MCKAPDINPMTLKGRKDAQREEGGKQERKEERRDKGNTNAEKPRPFSAVAHRVLWTWIFRAALNYSKGVLSFCAPHRALSYCRVNSGGDRPLVIVQLLDYATDSRIY